MSIKGKITAGFTNPHLAGMKINKELRRLYYGGSENEDGIDIFDADWDNLVILDACRYDVFESVHGLPGRLESRVTKGSATRQFVEGNFRGKKLHDVVYVSANGWYLKLRAEIGAEVHKFVALHEAEYRENEFNTTLPETVTSAALEANEEYPDKRLVVHYVQPHKPYIGEKGSRYFGGTSPNLRKAMSQLEHSNKRKVLEEAYRENLQEVLPEVADLLDDLEGKTVVTSDHGELLGERLWPIPVRGYGHPRWTYRTELVKVPWLVCESEERKEIVPAKPTEETETDMDETVEHLKDLGYF